VHVCLCVCVCKCVDTYLGALACLSAWTRCAGMAVCCNASCFADCLGSADGCDAALSGGQKETIQGILDCQVKLNTKH